MSIRGKIAAFEQDGANLWIVPHELHRHFANFALDGGGIECPFLFQNRLTELGLIFHSGKHDRDRVWNAAGGEMPWTEALCIGSNYAYSAARHSVHEGYLHQARQEDWYIDGLSNLFLEICHEPAGASNGFHTPPLKFQSRFHKSFFQCRITLIQKTVNGSAAHLLIANRICIGSRITDIAGHAGIGGIQNEDADLFPIP